MIVDFPPGSSRDPSRDSLRRVSTGRPSPGHDHQAADAQRGHQPVGFVGHRGRRTEPGRGVAPDEGQTCISSAGDDVVIRRHDLRSGQILDEPGHIDFINALCVLGEGMKVNMNLPTIYVAPQRELPTRISFESPAPDERSKSVSRPPRTRSAWITTRFAVMTPGTGTSPWPCSPTPTSPSPPRSPQKPWQRPHSNHAWRGQASPGTPDHHRSATRRDPGLVPLAQTPPTPRPASPLPATMHHKSRSAAGVSVLQQHLVGAP